MVSVGGKEPWRLSMNRVAQASEPAGSGGILPPAATAGRDARRTRSQDGCATRFMASTHVPISARGNHAASRPAFAQPGEGFPVQTFFGQFENNPVLKIEPFAR